MFLQSLKLSGVRNLLALSLDFCPAFNIVIGKNGSGKTSFLEAIHLLAQGRSFRSHHAEEFVSFKSSHCVLSGKIKPFFPEESPAISIGLEKHKTGQVGMQVNHQKCQSIAELAKLLPLQLMNTHTYCLLEGASRHRRQFLDWGMFHVEPRFFPVWQRYSRVLKQRNAALKRIKFEGKESVLSWNKELIETGESLNEFREHFLDTFKPLLTEQLGEFLGDKQFRLHYKKGWNEALSLSEALDRHWEQDLLRGYTGCGPHRADLQFLIDESESNTVQAEVTLSRGQQKLLICALLIARSQWLFQKTGQKALFLVDDLTSELDSFSSGWFLERLKEIGGQIILTAIDSGFLQNYLKDIQYKMFHVEQGQMVLV